MSTIRVKKNENYFHASNEPFNDSRLSWAARGVMGYLLSKPNDWIVRNNDLRAQWSGQGGGRDAIERIIRELKEAGYMRRIPVRNELGRITYETDVYESVSMNPAHDPTVPGLPGHGSPGHGSPGHGKPGHILITDLQTTENKSGSKNSRQPPILTSGAAAANQGLEEEKIPILKLLLNAGISSKMSLKLAAMDHMTSAYVEAHISDTNDKDESIGLLVTKLLDGDPAPDPPREPGYIPPEYEDIVKR